MTTYYFQALLININYVISFPFFPWVSNSLNSWRDSVLPTSFLSRLVAALSVLLALFARELAGFFLGVMFNSTQCLICILSNILLCFSALFPHLINFT